MASGRSLKRRDRAPALAVTALVLAMLAPACGREALPAGQKAAGDRHLVADTEEIKGVVLPDSNLANLLRAYLVPASAESATRLIAGVFDPRRLRAHQPFVLTRTLAGALRAFRYEIDNDTYLNVEVVSPADPTALRAEVITYARTESQEGLVGSIDAATPSLFESLDTTGATADLAIELAAIFSGEIDFNSELQPGDHYRLAFDKTTRENGTVSFGTIHAAEFFNDGRLLKAIRFVTPDGKAGYYDENGRSLKRFFLKSPLKFEPRITSKFSYSRKHPVLNIRRAHLGVDYAALVGAPVVAVSHGVVTRAGFAGQAGRLVALRHSSGYESMYLHLSSIAVKVGQRVSQGDMIGRVGSSGLSTGPHLDYRLRKDGTFVNPITEHQKMPPGEPIPAALLTAYRAQRDKMLALLPAAAANAGPAASATPQGSGGR